MSIWSPFSFCVQDQEDEWDEGIPDQRWDWTPANQRQEEVGPPPDLHELWGQSAVSLVSFLSSTWPFERSTVEPYYNEVLGTMKITLLYQVSHYITVKKQRNIKSWDQQITLL